MRIFEVLVPLLASLGILFLFWVLPVMGGIRTAKRRGFSPHWMWAGIHPFFAWLMWGILACLKRCPACGKMVGVYSRFCPLCSTSFAAGDAGQASPRGQGSSGGVRDGAMEAKLEKLKQILRAAEKANSRRSLAVNATQALLARECASDAQPIDEAALNREVSQLLTELESTPAGKAAQARENWWTLTSDVNQCPHCSSVIDVHTPYCNTCGAPTPRIICPCCGGHETQVKTQRLGYALAGMACAGMAGLCYALGEASSSIAMERLFLAWMFVFGGVAIVLGWFEISSRSKRVVCASCRQVSKIDPNTARWWTPEPADATSPEQDPDEPVEATAVEA